VSQSIDLCWQTSCISVDSAIAESRSTTFEQFPIEVVLSPQ